jgi:hypothetical protein
MSKAMIRQVPILRSCLILVFALIAGGSYAGTSSPDTSGKLLAALNKKEKPVFVTREANVIFPDVLSGNDEQSVDYIEKFATNRRDYIIRTYNKSRKFFPKTALILKKYNLPHELNVLLFPKQGQ